MNPGWLWNQPMVVMQRCVKGNLLPRVFGCCLHNWTLTPFVPNKHRTASVQRVLISLTISVEVPPEDGSVLLDEMYGLNKSHAIFVTNFS